MDASRKIAYLTSEHPAFSTAFLSREVERLRALNFDIPVASINSPRSPDEMIPDERAEVARTFYVKRAGIAGALGAHWATFLSAPGRYMRGLSFALRLGATSLQRLPYGFFYFSEALIVGQWMRARDLHHLHVHFANAAATVALIVSEVFQVGLSMTVHGPDEFYDVPGQLLKEKIARASFVCCISQFTRSQLMNVSNSDQWSKFELAPCGVDSYVFKPHLRREKPDPFEILCVARLVPAKGHRDLLAALHHLVSDGREIQLHLAGDGPERQELQREVTRLGLSRQVVFEGVVNQSRIRELYGSADAFVLPSFAEGVPISLMEAMAMQIACVSTFVGGIPELIRPNVDGILVMPSDYLSLAQAIGRLIDEPDLRRGLGAAGRRRVMEHYDLDRNISRLANIFLSRVPRSDRFRQASCDNSFDKGRQSQAHANTASN
jgi:glycosyltransferase involved in cell wall biosynthesis